MIRKPVTVVLVGALTFTVYLLTGDTVQQQTNEAADAGISPPNRDATCPIRLDPEYAAEQGIAKLYQRVLFPVTQVTPSTGFRDVTLPPMPKKRVRQALDVVDWNDCTLAASTAPVRALWGTQTPFTTAGVVKPWCRAHLPAQPCLLLDGGTFGDMNITACSARANPATCERVAGRGIYLGDSEGDL